MRGVDVPAILMGAIHPELIKIAGWAAAVDGAGRIAVMVFAGGGRSAEWRKSSTSSSSRSGPVPMVRRPDASGGIAGRFGVRRATGTLSYGVGPVEVSVAGRLHSGAVIRAGRQQWRTADGCWVIVSCDNGKRRGRAVIRLGAAVMGR